MTNNNSQVRIIQVNPSKLKYYERNNKKHPPEQIRQLMNSIREFGFVNPVLIDENDELIAGHGRTEAAKELQLKEIPAIRLIGLTVSQKRALRISDNKIAENASWDVDALTFELEALKLEEFDLDILGFSSEELERLLPVDAPEDNTLPPTQVKPKTSRIMIDCLDKDAEKLKEDITKLIADRKYAETELSIISSRKK